MLYFLNAISVAMFPEFPVSLEIKEVSIEYVVAVINSYEKDNIKTIINRKNVAQDLSNSLGIAINIDNEKILLNKKDTVFIVRHIPSKNISNKENLIVPNNPCVKFYEISIEG